MPLPAPEPNAEEEDLLFRLLLHKEPVLI